MPSVIPLGPFDLEAPVAKGGMGEVWQGVHRAQNVPVAVKVLGVEVAQDEWYLELFRNEVRSVASLDHANVVLVFDHGSVPDEVAQRSEGALTAASPYFVMEWASDGTLRNRGPEDWAQARSVLMTILDALAHAHARSVLHRDLKPSNVLMCAPTDLRPGLKLADFGLARPGGIGASTAAASGAGSHNYMAPEQVLGEQRSEGPWTDLYAVGCLAYWLVTGSPPFGHLTEEEALLAQVSEAPPTLEPLFPVPDGLVPWVQALLEKRPQRRLRQAADAALWLHGLAPADESDARRTAAQAAAREERYEGPTLTFATRRLGHRHAGPRRDTESGPPIAPIQVKGPSDPIIHPAPPVPHTWRHAGALRQPSKLRGAGLGLFGLRPIPMVNRDPERDALWLALRDAIAAATTRVVVLTGPAGSGKSRLAGWLCERASEVGAATALRAVHSEVGGPHGGIAAMIARHMATDGLDRSATLAHVHGLLHASGVTSTEEWLAVTELVAPSGPTELERARVIRLETPAERHEVVRRLLGRWSTERPLAVWLDDVQWSEDALALSLRLLKRPFDHEAPIILVLTCVDEALARREAERALMDELLAHPAVQHIPVGALQGRHRTQLFRELLSLDPDLASQLEWRTGGNPMFAAQLVGDWVERGLLELGSQGFKLAEDAAMDLPEGVHQLWGGRLDDLLADQDDDAAIGLEAASVLGREVDGAEWSGVCAHLGIEPPWAIVDALLDRRLAVAARQGPHTGWSFVHSALRESLEQRARESGRLTPINRACARQLQGKVGRRVAERAGRHLLAAGDALEAARPLLAGAIERRDAGDLRVASMLLAEREAGLVDASLPEEDQRWGEGWIASASVEVRRGGTNSLLLARRAEREGTQHGWVSLRARTQLVLSEILIKRGDLNTADEACREALAHYETAGDTLGAALAQNRCGIVALERGELERARDLQERAAMGFEAAGEVRKHGDCLYELGIIHRRLGMTGRAAELCGRAMAMHMQTGSRKGVANARVSLGEIARVEGKFEVAEREYRAALELYDAMGSASVAVARLNLGLALLARGRYVGAKEVLEEAMAELEGGAWWSMVACARVELMACAAAEGDWEQWDAHIKRATPLIEESGLVDPDLAWAAHLAADLAHEAGETTRARVVYALARAQWVALNRDDEASRIDERLEA